MSHQPDASTEEVRAHLRAKGYPADLVFVPDHADVWCMENRAELETGITMSVAGSEAPFSVVLCALGGSATGFALSILRSSLPSAGWDKIGAAYDEWLAEHRAAKP